MRQEEDDFTAWRRRQENRAAPFSCIYPQMPPRFRWCRRFTRALFLLEWASLLALIAGLLLEGAVMLFRGIETPMGDREAFAAGLMLLVLLPLYFLTRWLRHTPGRFWHCPVCRRNQACLCVVSERGGRLMGMFKKNASQVKMAAKERGYYENIFGHLL